MKNDNSALLNAFFKNEFLHLYETRELSVNRFDDTDIYYVTGKDSNIISYMALNYIYNQESTDI